MTVDRLEGNQNRVKMTECPHCGQELPDGTGFADHWERNCEVNNND